MFPFAKGDVFVTLNNIELSSNTNCVELRRYLLHVVTHLIFIFDDFPFSRYHHRRRHSSFLPVEVDREGVEFCSRSRLACGLVSFSHEIHNETNSDYSRVGVEKRKTTSVSADLYHSRHLPYQLLKTLYKLPSPQEKTEINFDVHRHQMLKWNKKKVHKKYSQEEFLVKLSKNL